MVDGAEELWEGVAAELMEDEAFWEGVAASEF